MGMAEVYIIKAVGIPAATFEEFDESAIKPRGCEV